MANRNVAVAHFERQAWVGWAIAVGLVPLLAIVAETQAISSVDGKFGFWHWGIAAMGIWAALGGYSLRRMLLSRSEREATAGNQEKSKQTWWAAELAAFYTSESVVLWGVVARYSLHPQRWFTAVFYGAGLALLLLYVPLRSRQTA